MFAFNVFFDICWDFLMDVNTFGVGFSTFDMLFVVIRCYLLVFINMCLYLLIFVDICGLRFGKAYKLWQ